MNDYFQNSYLRDKSHLAQRVNPGYTLIKYNPGFKPIVKALTKYGLGNFSLAILEFTIKEELLSREDFYLKTTNPKYNILENAGNSLGYKHTAESINKITDSVNSRLEDIRK